MATNNHAEAKPANSFRLFLSIAGQRSSLLGGLKIALVVGIAVNLINQGEQIIGLQLAQISLPKLMITFCIPFCVSIRPMTVRVLSSMTWIWLVYVLM